MTTKSDIENAIKEAMRAGDEPRKRTLRMVLAAIKLAEVEKSKGTVVDETAVAAMIQKEIKSRREAIADAQRANRPDLISAAEVEIAILEEYLPQAMTAAELEALAKQVISEVGATSPKEMGQVMKALMPRLQGRAPGDQVSQVVRKLLAG